MKKKWRIMEECKCGRLIEYKQKRCSECNSDRIAKFFKIFISLLIIGGVILIVTRHKETIFGWIGGESSLRLRDVAQDVKGISYD